MRFFRKYWKSIIIIALLAVLLFSSGKNNRDYKAEIQTKNDSIEVLSNRNQILQIQFERSEDLFIQSENDILKYHDSINILRNRNYRIRKTYENQIADIISIPTDSMYREISEWLDSQ